MGLGMGKGEGRERDGLRGRKDGEGDGRRGSSEGIYHATVFSASTCRYASGQVEPAAALAVRKRKRGLGSSMGGLCE